MVNSFLEDIEELLDINNFSFPTLEEYSVTYNKYSIVSLVKFINRNEQLFLQNADIVNRKSISLDPEISFNVKETMTRLLKKKGSYSKLPEYRKFTLEPSSVYSISNYKHVPVDAFDLLKEYTKSNRVFSSDTEVENLLLNYLSSNQFKELQKILIAKLFSDPVIMFGTATGKSIAIFIETILEVSVSANMILLKCLKTDDEETKLSYISYASDMLEEYDKRLRSSLYLIFEYHNGSLKYNEFIESLTQYLNIIHFIPKITIKEK